MYIFVLAILDGFRLHFTVRPLMTQAAYLWPHFWVCECKTVYFSPIVWVYVFTQARADFVRHPDAILNKAPFTSSSLWPYSSVPRHICLSKSSVTYSWSNKQCLVKRDRDGKLDFFCSLDVLVYGRSLCPQSHCSLNHFLTHCATT